MDCALEDPDGLGIDLCLGRRLGPLLRNARAQSVLSQSNQAANETITQLASCEVNTTTRERRGESDTALRLSSHSSWLLPQLTFLCANIS